MRGAQENLRLSANQVSKLNNELKITCNENEELKRKVQELSPLSRRCQTLEEKVVLFSAEIERLRSSSSRTENDFEGSRKKLAEYELK
jgi:hypothetical protein